VIGIVAVAQIKRYKICSNPHSLAMAKGALVISSLAMQVA
jgi:hypothetical protein